MPFILMNHKSACGSSTESAEFGNSSKAESPLTFPTSLAPSPLTASTRGSVTNQGWEGQ